MYIRIVVLLLVVAASPSQGQTVIFVDADANGTNDGSSWADAYVSLRDALLVGRAGTEVWVAEGVYTPDVGALVTVGDRSASFDLAVPIAVYGGFSGSESSREERDWQAHPTILSGDLAGNDPDTLTVGDTFTEDNSNNVVVVSSSFRTEAPTLDGVTVTGGRAVAQPGDGGGIRIESGAHASLVRVTVERNYAGGWGGGIAAFGTLDLRDSTVRENRSGVGRRGVGGGIAVSFNALEAPAPPNPVEFRRVTVADNRTGGCGGGLWLQVPSQPGLAFPFMAQLTDVFFRGNASEDTGGGACLTGGGDWHAFHAIAMVNARFVGNESGSEGSAGLLVEMTSAAVHNSLFKDNEIVVPNRERPGAIGVIEQAGLDLTQATVVDNIGVNAHALMVSTSNVRIANSIIWGHEGPSNGVVVRDASSLVVQSSLVQGGLPAGATGSNILDQSPRFAPSAEPDQFGLRLAADSPGVDAGNTALIGTDITDLDNDELVDEQLPFDLAGVERIKGAGVDLGAYEYHGPLASDGLPSGPRSACKIQPPAPNPTDGHTSITVHLAAPAAGGELEVWDVLGRKHDMGLNRLGGDLEHILVLDAYSLAAGLYFVRLSHQSVYQCAVGLVVQR